MHAQGAKEDCIAPLIKDPDLADEAAATEQDRTLDAAASRARIKAAIEQRYTAAA